MLLQLRSTETAGGVTTGVVVTGVVVTGVVGVAGVGVMMGSLLPPQEASTALRMSNGAAACLRVIFAIALML